MYSEYAEVLVDEASQRRWTCSSDVAWQTIVPLPVDIEIALGQVHSELAKYAETDVEILNIWLASLADDSVVAKQFLDSARYDAMQRAEAWYLRTPSKLDRQSLPSHESVDHYLYENDRDLNDTLTKLAFIRNIFLLVNCEYLLRHAYNKADNTIFSYVIQDLARLVSFVIIYLKERLNEQPQYIDRIQSIVNIGLIKLRQDLHQSTFKESITIVFAGGRANARKLGLPIFNELIEEYCQRLFSFCFWLGIKQTSPSSVSELLIK